jgi:hypothetical protein
MVIFTFFMFIIFIIKVRETRIGSQEWTLQRIWQHWAHKPQDEAKQNTRHRMKPNKTQDEAKQNTRHRMKPSKTQDTG